MMQTWMDKYRNEHPEMTEHEIVADRCPPDRCKLATCPTDYDGSTMGCVECWMRKYAEVECCNPEQQTAE